MTAIGEAPRPASARQRLVEWATPLLCSAPVFPAWFEMRVRSAATNPARRSFPFLHAQRYFGSALIVDVDPNRLRLQLRSRVRGSAGPVRLTPQFLDGSDWTAELDPIPEQNTAREMAELVRFGADFRAMPTYAALVAQAEAGKPADKNGVVLATEPLIIAYFEHYLRLVDIIRDKGVLKRADLPPSLKQEADSPVRAAGRENSERDAGAAITADGELVRFESGRHRTAIAQALGLRSMPVEVRLVHIDWLLARMAETGLPAAKALASHLDAIGGRSRSPGGSGTQG